MNLNLVEKIYYNFYNTRFYVYSLKVIFSNIVLENIIQYELSHYKILKKKILLYLKRNIFNEGDIV